APKRGGGGQPAVEEGSLVFQKEVTVGFEGHEALFAVKTVLPPEGHLGFALRAELVAEVHTCPEIKCQPPGYLDCQPQVSEDPVLIGCIQFLIENPVGVV